MSSQGLFNNFLSSVRDWGWGWHSSHECDFRFGTSLFSCWPEDLIRLEDGSLAGLT